MKRCQICGRWIKINIYGHVLDVKCGFNYDSHEDWRESEIAYLLICGAIRIFP